MTEPLQALAATAREVFGDALVSDTIACSELTLEVWPEALLKVAKRLRDDNRFRFEQLTDVCGVDYLSYRAESPEGPRPGPRFAAVYHLVSISRNQRLRVRVFAADDGLPRIDSVVEIWPSANWYEREAFDLYGIVFEGHPDLRRILLPEDWAGFPLRKDYASDTHCHPWR